MAANSAMASLSEESCFKTFRVVILSCRFPELPVVVASPELRHTVLNVLHERRCALCTACVKLADRLALQGWCVMTCFDKTGILLSITANHRVIGFHLVQGRFEYDVPGCEFAPGPQFCLKVASVISGERPTENLATQQLGDPNLQRLSV